MNESIDLNCDLGEGQGHDEEILPFVTSANVACGLHAGGPSVMRQTVEAAARLGVAVGAHPGFADREGFGRAEQGLSPTEIYDLVAYQIGALEAFTRKARMKMQHVKAHGALYHLAGRNAEVADALASAARETAGRPVMIGAPGTLLEEAARKRGLRFAAEGFSDRGYAAGGTLVPRDQPGAMVDGDDATVAGRALRLARDGKVPTVAGADLILMVHTLCVHGDDPRAAGRARAIREALVAGGMKVRPLAAWLE
jgi:UPF0271 protein